jgi:type I restriction enzyme S subunit
MSTYKSYRPSGVEWIGEIPEGWEVKKLFYFGEVNLGKMLTPEDKGGYVLKPYLRSQNIQSDRVDVSDVKEMWFTENELIRLRLRKDDLLLNEGGDVGRTCIWNGELEECYFQNSVNRVRFKNDLQKYFLYLSNLYHHMKYYDSIVNRVSIPHLTKEKLESVRFLRPPLNEQEQIVKYLDEKTSIIDKLISTKQRKVELLKEQRTTLINQVITKGLKPDVKMKESGVEWIGEIPKEWDIVKIKYVTDRVVDGTHFTPNYIDSGVPFLRVTDIQTQEIDLDKVKFISKEEHEILIKRCNPQKGDILLSKNGTIGITKIIDWDWEFSIFVSLCLIKFKKTFNPYLFSYFFQSDIVNQQIFESSKKTSVSNLHLDKIRELLLIKPTIQEQEQLVDYLDKHTREIEDLFHLEQKKIELLKEYRQSLISEVITGKIKVI